MVRGLDRFRAHFAGYEDRYALIGGAAVDILMDEAGLEFRATKDLDIVLLIEALDEAFGRAVWEFVELGGYENRCKSTGDACFYRFHSPTDASYPYMLEFFSRRPDGFVLPEDAHLTPLPLAEELSSLSAILLDDAYYEFLRAETYRIDGLSLLGPERLIPLKMKAWLDLTECREAGERVDGRDIKKHRNDVVRLYQLIPTAARVELPPTIAEDVCRFLKVALADFEPSAVKVKGVSAEDVRRALRDVYGVVV